MRIKNCGIYKITNTKNGKIYIGSSIDINARWSRHISQLRLNTHPNSKLQRGWNKHGEIVFTFEIILLCLQKELIVKEQQCIDLFKPWYNIDLVAGVHQIAEQNGQFGRTCSEETKNKLRIANSKPKSEETKVKMREYHAKVRAGLLPARSHRSEEAKKAQSERQKGISPKIDNTGRKHSPETIEKMSKVKLGKSVSKEARQKISAKLTGVPLSDERKQAMRGPRKPQSAEQIAKRVASRKATLIKQGRTH